MCRRMAILKKYRFESHSSAGGLARLRAETLRRAKAALLRAGRRCTLRADRGAQHLDVRLDLGRVWRRRLHLEVGLERLPRLRQPCRRPGGCCRARGGSSPPPGPGGWPFRTPGSPPAASPQRCTRQRQVELRGVVVREQPGRLAVLVGGTRPVALTPDRMRQVEVIRPAIGRDRNRLLEARDRPGEIALPVENLADAVERFRIVGLLLERRLELRLAPCRSPVRKAAVPARDVSRKAPGGAFHAVAVPGRAAATRPADRPRLHSPPRVAEARRRRIVDRASAGCARRARPRAARQPRRHRRRGVAAPA